MAKEITIKTKEGVAHVFALKEVILKGELVAVYPSGGKASLCPTQYAYGESYVDKIPDALISAGAAALIPTEIEAESDAGEVADAGAGEASGGGTESAGE